MVDSRIGVKKTRQKGEGREEVDVVDDKSNADQAISALVLARIAPSGSQFIGCWRVCGAESHMTFHVDGDFGNPGIFQGRRKDLTEHKTLPCHPPGNVTCPTV